MQEKRVWIVRFGRRGLPALTLAGLAAGAAAWLAHMPRVADLIWAASTAAALLPLAYAVVRTLLSGRAGVDVIALLAMGGALALHQYLAGAVIALMLAGGQALEAFADALARRELSSLVERSPRAAHRYENGVLATRDVGEIRAGDLLLVKPGEVLPVDGVVTDAFATLDESALTGEAGPVERRHGERVFSGTINSGGAPLNMRAAAAAAQSAYAGIVRLVEQAQASKAPLVRLADRYAMLFLPFTLAIAGLAWWLAGDATRALAVLVVATPCPLILAAPVAMVSGISRAARRGIIVKGGGALEVLARGRILLLDKTGTVTQGAPVLTHIEVFGQHDADDLLRLAASLDMVSPHVLARPIIKAANERGLDLAFPSAVSEELGAGIRGRIDGHTVALGKSDWILEGQPAPSQIRRLRRRSLLEGSSSVFVAVDGEPAGALILEDPLRPDAPYTIRALRRVGFDRIVMLTGDHPDVAQVVGAVLGVDEVLAERRPAEKLEAVETARETGVTVMVGDGINDAPALSAAHVGVAMGARGATASSEAADVVLIVDRLDRLIEAVRIARRSRSIALQSILAGMLLSAAGMALATAGMLAPVMGAVLQEAIDVLAILNALRALGGGWRQPSGNQAHVELSQQYRAEHKELLHGVRHIRQVADQLESMSPLDARREMDRLYVFLKEDLLPHEEAEDAAVYPVVARLIGGQDPTATMSRAHMEIAHQVRVLGRTLQDLPPEGPERDDVRELRGILYGLSAILRLHFAQEEESYLALIDEGRSSRA
ncbi:MAG TPA: heavy metal translocating P-type ATPase [Bryobacteraceae bacterium]|nr:heavy metal translocating P-type ATPase [Bryobacteraceae bacterium]